MTKNFAKKAFSLIEFLCVMAIVALIFSLLHPSLRKIIHHTYTIECQNNLKTVGVGIQAYAEDYDYSLPGPSLGGQSPIYLYNNGKIMRKQVGSYIAEYLTVVPTGKPNSYYLKEYLCPANEAEELTPDLYFRVTFRVNRQGEGPFGYPSSDKTKPHRPPKKIFEINSPESTYALADADRQNCGYLNVGAAPELPVHESVSRNYLFFDFHVENVFGY